MLKINRENVNVFTVLSLLALVAGILFYLYWGTTFGVWYDIGIYSLTIVLVVAGVVGTVLSLMETTED